MYERKDIPSMNETPSKSDSERGHRTTARSRAIEAWRSADSGSFFDAVVDGVFERMQQKTSAPDGKPMPTPVEDRTLGRSAAEATEVQRGPESYQNETPKAPARGPSGESFSERDKPGETGVDFGVTYCIEGYRLVLSCPCGRETVRSWFGNWQRWSCDGCGAIHLRPGAASQSPAAPASSSALSDGRPDREALGRAAYEAKCFAEGNAAIPYGWKPAELGPVWEQWRVVGERLYEMGRKDGEARATLVADGDETDAGIARYMAAEAAQKAEAGRRWWIVLRDGSMAAFQYEGTARAHAPEGARIVEVVPATRAEAAERKSQRRLDALYEVSQACRIGASPDPPEVAIPRGVREMLAQSVAWTDREKLRAAEARVRELEAAARDVAKLNVLLIDSHAADVMEKLRAALRPTAPTADDGDEKERDEAHECAHGNVTAECKQCESKCRAYNSCRCER